MQKYTEIPSSTTLADSLPMILNNDKSVISCHSGSAFPSTDLQVGMLCYRTDEKKLYILVDSSAGTWKTVTEAFGDNYLLAGTNGTAIDYSKKNLDSWMDMPTGFYQGTHMINAPKGDINWRVLQFREDNSSGWATQLAFSANTRSVCVRFEMGGSWSDWYDLAMSKEGAISEGLNSDLLRGLHPSNEHGQISINNGTLNKGLNAEMLSGMHASNAAYSIPISNTELNEGLNADTVHGHKAGNDKGNIPLNNTKLNVGLNAEMLNGVKIDRVLNLNSADFIDRSFGVRELSVDVMSVKNFTARIYDASKHDVITQNGPWRTNNLVEDPWNEKRSDWTRSYGDYVYNPVDNYWMETKPAISAGTYPLYTLLQKLVNLSHEHKVHHNKVWSSTNCNCKCNCDCRCGDDGR